MIDPTRSINFGTI